MVNIVVPTDFSDLSRVAIQFAVKVANKLDGNITLLHVLTMIQPTRASMRLRYQALEMDLIEFAEEDFKPIIAEAEKVNKTNHSIKHKIEKGQSFNDTVKRFAKRRRTGLIIIGTRGASGLKKYVMGSSTSSLIEVSHVPVLVVPEKATFSGFKNVVYATNLDHIENELKALLPYLKIFDSQLHILHVMRKNEDIEEVKAKIAKAWQKMNYKRITVSLKTGDEVDKVIESYVNQVKGDLITMFTHEKSFYQKLFNRSITKKMAFHSTVPLLAFRLRS
jgi:nucleotide-binding universal stress UspA family protein